VTARVFVPLVGANGEGAQLFEAIAGDFAPEPHPAKLVPQISELFDFGLYGIGQTVREAATRFVAARRAKQSPLKDVAGMLRSLSYAAYAGLIGYTARRPEDWESLEPWARLWERYTGAEFLRAYRHTVHGAAFLPAAERNFRKLLKVHSLDKALNELAYELNNRPAWVRIPLLSILSVPMEAGGREWKWMPSRSRN